MAETPKQSKSHIVESEQELLKKSRDDKYDVLIVEKAREVPSSNTAGTLLRESADGNDLTSIIDDSTTANTIYFGWALPGTATSSATWKIKKVVTTSGASTTWADGDTLFNNVWDNRAVLSYS